MRAKNLFGFLKASEYLDILLRRNLLNWPVKITRVVGGAQVLVFGIHQNQSQTPTVYHLFFLKTHMNIHLDCSYKAPDSGNAVKGKKLGRNSIWRNPLVTLHLNAVTSNVPLWHHAHCPLPLEMTFTAFYLTQNKADRPGWDLGCPLGCAKLRTDVSALPIPKLPWLKE